MAFMARPEQVILPIDAANLDAFGRYREDQLKDNGHDGTPLFQPQSQAGVSLVSEKIALFQTGLAASVGEPKWRRGWVALDASGTIIGHVDLRDHPEPCTAHRALLGMGVHRAHRGQGVGRALVTFAIAWATNGTTLEWIDLQVLSGNAPAESLYGSVGFHDIATVQDMFRVDGRSVDSILMTMRILRWAEAPPT